MKFLITSLALVGTTNTIVDTTSVVTAEHNILETINHEITFNQEIEMFHKDTTSKDFISNGQFVNISSNQPSKFILNEEQTTLLNDTSVRELNIRINYQADFITNKVKKSVNVSQDFDDLLKETTKSNEYKLKDFDGKEISFFIESKDTKIVHRETKGKSSLQLLPYLKFKLNDFENDKRNGFYSLKITSIVITGKSEAYNLSKIKRKNYAYHFDKGQEINPREFLKTEKFINWYKTNFESWLTYEIIDWDKTLQKVNPDQFNSEVNSNLTFKICLKEQYNSVGEFIQTIAFKIDEIEKPEWEPDIKNQPEHESKTKPDYSDYEKKDTTKFSHKPAKQVNALKYLWLLVIPVLSGIATLITYFVPFRKRKRKNEIK